MKPDGPLSESWKGIIGKPGRNNNFWLHSNFYIHHRFKTCNNESIYPTDSYCTNSAAEDSPNNSISVNQDNLVQIEHTGSFARDYVNGLKIVETTSQAQIPVDGTTYIARNLDGSDGNYFKGSIKEILIFNRVLSDQERFNINYYLSAKWNMKSLVDSDGDELIDVNDTEPVNQNPIDGYWHVDSDGDGFNDVVEEGKGTSPTDASDKPSDLLPSDLVETDANGWKYITKPNVWSTCKQKGAGQYGPTAGTQTKTRTCVQPKFGGNACPGLASESQDCNFPRDGGWSDWDDWNICSTTGKDTRSRTCNNPTPAWGGADCPGSATEERTSTSKKDGYWTPWTKSNCVMGMWAFDRNKVAPVCGGAEAQGDPWKFEDAELHWEYCSHEYQTCNFSQSGLGEMRVRYGLYGHYYYGNHSSGVACSNGVFGDPLWGYTKQCHYTCPEVDWSHYGW